MKKLFSIILVLFFTTISFADDVTNSKEDVLTLMKEINRFEKEVPFFTKSKITVFLQCDSPAYIGSILTPMRTGHAKGVEVKLSA